MSERAGKHASKKYAVPLSPFPSPLLGAKDGDLFLRFAEEQDTFGLGKALPIFRGDILLALFSSEGNDRDLVLLDERLHLTQEGVAHDPHQRRGSNRLAAIKPEEASSLLLRLQLRLVDIEVHAVDALDFQGYVLAEDISHAARYTHGWLRSTKVFKTTTALSGQTLGLRQQTPPIDRSLFYSPNPNTPRRSEAEPR